MNSKNSLSFAERVKNDLSLLNKAENVLKEDMLSLHNKNLEEFLVLEILNILIPFYPNSESPPSTTSSLTSSNIQDSIVNLYLRLFIPILLSFVFQEI